MCVGGDMLMYVQLVIRGGGSRSGREPLGLARGRARGFALPKDD